MKLELLLPAGNAESFNAAMEGGADAVYLGVEKFNARGRADNFTLEQLQSALKIAGQQGRNVYLTLNTVIKNEELPELLELLSVVAETHVAALIIQDWGVYYLVKKYFPQVKIHASTQMQTHNSVGVNFSHKMDFNRVNLARELTLEELKSIKKNTILPLVVFAHGSLCYSFSGTCLFSSFLDGNSANRGLCTQPCRMLFETGESKKFLFSLKDLQLISYVPMLMELGISTLKIEGRMRSSEYTYRVAKAYRMAIDEPERMGEAKEILTRDLGRPKTSYFMGENLQKAISDNPATGIFLGKITRVSAEGFAFNAPFELEAGNTIRVHSPEGEVKEAIRLKDFYSNKRNFIKIDKPDSEAKKGDLIYLAEFRDDRFQSNLSGEGENVPGPMEPEKRNEIISGLKHEKEHNQRNIFVRIDQVEWIKKIYIRSVDKVIMNFPKRQWKDFMTGNPFIQRNKKKFIIELPKFIAEDEIDHYRSFCHRCKVEGFTHFMVSQLSQMDLLPDNVTVSVNENVYSFNDAAIALFKEKGIRHWVYPYENDKNNLGNQTDRDGIVPLLFHPDLFYSRMHVKLEEDNQTSFTDDKENVYVRTVRDGMTIITPEIPVAFFQDVRGLKKEGFHNFLIDFSRINPSQNKFNTYIKHLHDGDQLEPSVRFNFARGLK